MGRSGPVPGTGGRPRKRTPEQAAKVAGRPVPVVASVVALVPATESLPDAPADFAERAVELWEAIWGSAPWLSTELDSPLVRLHVEAIEERDWLRESLLELGPTLKEPIVSPKGDVVGTRIVSNPLLPALRRLESRIERSAERLGLSPGSRIRLGLAEAELRQRAGRLNDPKLAWRKP